MARSNYIYHVYDLYCYDTVAGVEIPLIRSFTVKREARKYVDKRIEASGDPSELNTRFRCIRYRDDIDEKPVLLHL